MLYRDIYIDIDILEMTDMGMESLDLITHQIR